MSHLHQDTIVEVRDAMRLLIDELRQEVRGLAGQEFVGKLAIEVDRLSDLDALARPDSRP